jgi:hypothetical protein
VVHGTGSVCFDRRSIFHCALHARYALTRNASDPMSPASKRVVRENIN